MALTTIKPAMTMNDLTPDEVIIIQQLRQVDKAIRADINSFLADWLRSQRERHKAASKQRFTVI